MFLAFDDNAQNKACTLPVPGLPDFSRESHANINKVCTHEKDYEVSLKRLQSFVSFAKQNATKVSNIFRDVGRGGERGRWKN